MDCPTGKRKYPNVKSARTALTACHDKRDRLRRRKRRESSFYRCEFCSSFHLTSEDENGDSRFR